MGYVDHFGFLYNELEVEVECCKISLTKEYNTGREFVDKYLDKDGFVYLPTEKDKPSMLHKMPVSHTIEINNEKSEQYNRLHEAGLFINCLSFLCGTRLQFHDWWFDARVPIKISNWMWPHPKSIPEFLQCAYEYYKNQDEYDKNLLNNIFYMHSRFYTYVWEYEKVLFEHMVFEALYRINLHNHKESINALVKAGIKNKLKVLCELFGMEYDEDVIKRITKLRNELVHESLWDGVTPGTKGSNDIFPAVAGDILYRLNSRIICCTIGYFNQYSKSDCKNIGRFLFDAINSNKLNKGVQ